MTSAREFAHNVAEGADKHKKIIWAVLIVLFLVAVALMSFFAYKYTHRKNITITSTTITDKPATESTKPAEQPPVSPPVAASPTYISYENTDAPGNDIGPVPHANIRTDVNAMQALCNSNSECKGFNSDGWIKRDVSKEKQVPMNGYTLWVKQ